MKGSELPQICKSPFDFIRSSRHQIWRHKNWCLPCQVWVQSFLAVSSLSPFGMEIFLFVPLYINSMQLVLWFYRASQLKEISLSLRRNLGVLKIVRTVNDYGFKRWNKCILNYEMKWDSGGERCYDLQWCVRMSAWQRIELWWLVFIV